MSRLSGTRNQVLLQLFEATYICSLNNMIRGHPYNSMLEINDVNWTLEQQLQQTSKR